MAVFHWRLGFVIPLLLNGIQVGQGCMTLTFLNQNTLRISCSIPTFSGTGSWFVDGVGPKTNCGSNTFCTTTIDGNYTFTSDPDGIYVQIDQFSSDEIGKLWKCVHPPSFECNETVTGPSDSQSNDSCDCDYWKCIGIILAVVIAFSLLCTVMLVWKRKLIQLKAKLIVCCCEKIKWTYWWGTSVLLLVAVLIILTITTLVIWLITMLIVIFTCCASEECNEGGKVAGISFVLSLVVILIFLVVFWIICHCKDPGYMVYTVECGDNKTLLADFTPPDGQIDSVKWTYQGSTVSHENASGGTLECPSLKLTMVSLDQSGVYVCVISCNLGEMQEQKVFHFKLLVTPQQYEVKIGDSVKLLKFLKNCQQIRNVEWTHTNKTITTNSCFYTGGDKSNPVLKVNCFATSDSGLYHCRVESGTTEYPKWFSANLKIKEQQEVKVGERIVLLKKLGISADVRSVVWTHDKRSLVSESYCGYEGGTMECPSLTIPVVSIQNAGKYECILEMKQGEFRIYRVILEVIEGNRPRQLPPRRIASPGKVHPEVGT